MTEILITVSDFRVVGICKHSRAWFKDHGRDWSELRTGIPLSWFKAQGQHERKVADLEKAARKRLGL